MHHYVAQTIKVPVKSVLELELYLSVLLFLAALPNIHRFWEYVVEALDY